MEDVLAMCYVILKPVGDAVVEIVNAVCSLPKRTLKILFEIQIKAICLAFNCLIKTLRVVKNSRAYEYFCLREPDSKPESSVDHQAVVEGIKKMRRVLCCYHDRSHEVDFEGDFHNILELNAARREAMRLGDKVKEAELTAQIKAIKKPYEDGTVDKKLRARYEVREVYEGQPVLEGRIVDYCEDINPTPPCSPSKLNDIYQMDYKGGPVTYDKNGKFRSARNKTPDKESLKCRLNRTNSKLEELLFMSTRLVSELSKFNGHFGRIELIRETMATMERQLGEGRKLICEIEADRDELKEKLSILEGMIKEEEQYLDDVSYESGYDESEIYHQPEL